MRGAAVLLPARGAAVGGGGASVAGSGDSGAQWIRALRGPRRSVSGAPPRPRHRSDARPVNVPVILRYLLSGGIRIEVWEVGGLHLAASRPLASIPLVHGRHSPGGGDLRTSLLGRGDALASGWAVEAVETPDGALVSAWAINTDPEANGTRLVDFAVAAAGSRNLLSAPTPIAATGLHCRFSTVDPPPGRPMLHLGRRRGGGNAFALHGGDSVWVVDFQVSRAAEGGDPPASQTDEFAFQRVPCGGHEAAATGTAASFFHVEVASRWEWSFEQWALAQFPPWAHLVDYEIDLVDVPLPEPGAGAEAQGRHGFLLACSLLVREQPGMPRAGQKEEEEGKDHPMHGICLAALSRRRRLDEHRRTARTFSFAAASRGGAPEVRRQRRRGGDGGEGSDASPGRGFACVAEQAQACVALLLHASHGECPAPGEGHSEAWPLGAWFVPQVDGVRGTTGASTLPWTPVGRVPPMFERLQPDRHVPAGSLAGKLRVTCSQLRQRVEQVYRARSRSSLGTAAGRCDVTATGAWRWTTRSVLTGRSLEELFHPYERLRVRLD